MPRTMTARGQAMMDYYPLFLQSDPLLQAVNNAAGGEFELLDDALDELMRNVIPITADEHLDLWEAGLNITVNPPFSVERRRSIVLSFIARAVLTGQGIDWVRMASLILGAGWTYSVGGVKNSELTVTIPYSAGSLGAGLAEKLLEATTPATMTINVTYAGGFILDESLLDDDLL